MNKKKNILLLFILLICITVLSGCWDVNEPQRMFYVHGVGVDYKDNQFVIYLQIINFANVAKSEQPNTAAVQAEVGVAKGDTLQEAFNNLYLSIDERVYWGHLMYLIFSEELLKNEDVNAAIDTFSRYRETRYQTWIYFTDDSVKEVLLATPIINKSLTLSKLADPKNSYSQESFVEPINLRKLIIQLNEPSHEVAVPLIVLKENWETQQSGKIKISTLSGVGVISPKEFKGFIRGDKAKGLQWMSEKTKRGEITVKLDSKEDKFLTVILEKVKVKVKPVIENDEVKFDISIKVLASLSGLNVTAKTGEIQKAVQKEVKKQIEDTYKEALKNDADIFRLSEHVYRRNFKVWKELQKEGKVELTEESIRDIKVDIKDVLTGRKFLKETIEK